MSPEFLAVKFKRKDLPKTIPNTCKAKKEGKRKLLKRRSTILDTETRKNGVIERIKSSVTAYIKKGRWMFNNY